jgi:hypothetical protein
MRKFYALLLMALFVSMGYAAEVTIQTSELYSATGNTVAKAVQAPFTFEADKGAGTNDPAFANYDGGGKDLRLYVGNTYKITTTGDAITKIVFNISAQGLKRLCPVTASVGQIAEQAAGDKTVTWTGSAKEITITVPTTARSDYGTDDDKAGQFDFDAMIITTDGEGGEEGGEQGGGDVEGGVATIAEFLALEDGAEFTFTGEAYVTYHNSTDKRYLFIADATGVAMIYNNNLSLFEQGAILVPNWTGVKTNYNGQIEITDPANLAADETQDLVEVTPTELAVANVTVENQNTYAIIKGATISDLNGKNFTISDGENSVAAFNKFNITMPTEIEEKAFDIVGVVTVFNNAVQFQPASIVESGDEPTPVELEISDLGDLYDLEDGVEFTFVGENTYVNYQNGQYLYLLQDIYDEDDDYDHSSAALIFGKINGGEKEYEIGHLINPGWKGKKTSYKGLVEIVDATGLNDGEEFVNDVEYNTAAFDNSGDIDVLKYFNDSQNYKMMFEGVTISDVDDKGNFNINQKSRYVVEEVDPETGETELYYAYDEEADDYLYRDATLYCYNRWKIEVPTRLDKLYTVTGMMAMFNGELQMYPISIERQSNTLEDAIYYGGQQFISDDLYVVFADDDSQTVFVTDNLYDPERYNGWFPKYPSWVALDCSENPDFYETILYADAINGVEGEFTDLVNPTLKLSEMPVVVEEPEFGPEDIILFNYDLKQTEDNPYGLQGAMGNEIAYVMGTYKKNAAGQPQLINCLEEPLPAVDVDFGFFKGEPWEEGYGYTTISVITLKEAWDSGDEGEFAPVKKVAARNARVAKGTVTPKQAKAMSHNRKARRVGAYDDNYYENLVVCPINGTVTAVKTVETGKQVAKVEYINALGQKSNRAFDGMNIVVTKYTDGTTSTVKVVK